MSVIRTLYVGQKVQILTGPTGSRTTGYLPISSASCEVTKPIEAVTSFGKLGALAIAQTNVTTCKSSLKSYLPSGLEPFDGLAGSGSYVTGISAALLRSITGDAVNGYTTVLTVSPNGFTMTGMLTSLGIDMTMGGLGTVDFAFNGVGQPVFADLTGASTTPWNEMPQSISPVTTAVVGGWLKTGACANSFKFSLDMPTEVLSCLGDVPDAPQAEMTSVIATKPPYKATLSLEGYGINISTNEAILTGESYGTVNKTAKFTLGHLGIQLPEAIITSKSFNNAAGNANASYNISMEDTSATFTDEP